MVAPHAHTFVLSHGFEIMESAGIGLREWIDRPLRANPQIPIKFAICKEAELGELSVIVIQLSLPNMDSRGRCNLPYFCHASEENGSQ